MTEAHRATPEQWARISLAAQPREIAPGIFCGDSISTLSAGVAELRDRLNLVEQERDARLGSLIDVRDRLAAAEQRISELEGNPKPLSNLDQIRSSAPAGSLVEMVADTLHVEAGFRDTSLDGPWDVEARAAILAVADWLERNDYTGGRWLREEVKRND